MAIERDHYRHCQGQGMGCLVSKKIVCYVSLFFYFEWTRLDRIQKVADLAKIATERKER